MKVKVLFGTVNLEQSKETLRAELGRSKMQSKMVYGGKEQSLSRAQDHFFNTSTEASVAVSLVEGAKCKRVRGRISFAGDKILESESYLSRFCQFYCQLLTRPVWRKISTR